MVVPAGYVGHDQGGRLVNELNADPYGVFLLDEADKSHPDVMQPFLNLFDEGWLYDQRGVKAYADRAIFILTTNVGQRQVADMFKAGKSIDEITHSMKETLSRIRHNKSSRPVFTPEFLARIKRIIVFRPLDQTAMLAITRKLVAEMTRDWLAKRQKNLVLPDTILKAIGEKGHAINERSQGKEGGRILRKLLAEIIEAPIQRAISNDMDGYRSCKNVLVECLNMPESPAGDTTTSALLEKLTISFTR
jgi:ATP-dependent Clp protease ATP-binding subunit ClpC